MATLAAVTNLPALGLVGEGGKLERSTEPFRRWYEDKQELVQSAPELKRVLEGQANAAVLKLDGIAVDIAAMADRDGGRHVMLTLPTGALPSLGDPGEALLDGALDESPALVWLKDLEGRYVRVNARFTEFLGTSDERLLGRTDAELPPGETVDGPRIQDRTEDVEEPLQLEYFVGPFQGREGLAVLRFPVGDRQGVPTLVCGVAAPSSEAQVARSEAARLLRVERWSRLDAESVQAELLAEWGLLPDARGRSASPAPSAAPVPGSAEQEAAVAEARAERATAIAERDPARAATDPLNSPLDATQARLAEAARAHPAARADGERSDAEARLAEQAAELDRALARERERAEELERSLALVRQRLGDDAEAARAEVQRARADADAARTEVQRARADAEAARADLDKARADAEAVRATALAERESAASARAELEREVRQSRDELAALERQQGADDSGAQLRASEKARLAAETALADAVAERDAALKARAALAGELEHERKQVAALADGAAASEARILELAAAVERERVRAAVLEDVQARVKELEGELRSAIMRADKTGVELQVAAAQVDKAEAEVEQSQARVTHIESELERARTKGEELSGKLEQGRAQVVELQGEVKFGQARVAQLEGEVKTREERIERFEEQAKLGAARIAELEEQAKLGEARIAELEEDLARAQAQAEEDAATLADDEPAPAPEREPSRAVPVAELARLDETPSAGPGNAAGGVSWQPTAKRALSASLARESVWRNVLKETVEVLGAEGGWDTVTAWLPDESDHLGCAATWTAHRGLDRFEALTWEVSLTRDGSLLDQALQAPHLTWLTDLDTVDDERLQTAAAHGMNSALLLPVRTGKTTVGLLELLTHDSIEPDAQIALSLEASALQLGRFGQLLSLGK